MIEKNRNIFRLQQQTALFLFTAVLLLLSSCAQPTKRYVIGVSQCSDDIWREKLNNELRTSNYLYEGVELHFASAYDSDERQVEQIDSLLRLGIDLLIVAPNQVQTVSPAIDRAFDQGTPVIVFDRKTNSKKYTAYIGADNYDMGRQMGEYIAHQLEGHGRVIEVMGLKGSSPAIDRHRGFIDAISHYPDIECVATLQGDWTEQSAYDAVKSYKGDLTHIDYVFGQNDRMAIGARRALSAGGLPLVAHAKTQYCGIDGLPGKDGGIEAVRATMLHATSVYPTRGDLVMQLAMNILEGRPYDQENLIRSAIVTRANAEVMLMGAEEMKAQSGQLDQLHERIDWYLAQYRHQQVYMVLLFIIILLVLLGAWYAMRTQHRQHELEREAFALLVNEKEIPVPAPVVNDPVGSKSVASESVTSEPVQQSAASIGEQHFLEQLRQLVHKRMNDSDLSVESLAEEMGLSRVQFYRKVKLLTGRTPVDIIRQSRLNRAHHLLQTTNMSVSQVAYEVGFTAPSYFTKCFKDEFGVSPSERQPSSEQQHSL